MKNDFSFWVKEKPPMSKHPNDFTNIFAMCGLVSLTFYSLRSGKSSSVKLILLFTFALGADVAVTMLSLKQKRVDVRDSG
jgi:hypothetical protein